MLSFQSEGQNVQPLQKRFKIGKSVSEQTKSVYVDVKVVGGMPTHSGWLHAFRWIQNVDVSQIDWRNAHT